MTYIFIVGSRKFSRSYHEEQLVFGLDFVSEMNRDLDHSYWEEWMFEIEQDRYEQTDRFTYTVDRIWTTERK